MRPFQLLFTAFALAGFSANAQLYIGPAFALYVQPGSELFIDSLVLKPDVPLALSDLEVSKSYTAVSTPSGNTIKRVYTITAPINFSGEVGFYYDNSELNGMLPSSLSIAYENSTGGGFTVGSGGMVTPAINYVSLPLNTTTSLARVSAIGSGAPLPVSLLSYTATAIDGKGRLDWITANEQNHDYFEILRSADGRNFQVVKKVYSKGNNAQGQTYFAWDDHPLNGTNYYKLAQYDLNGKTVSHGVRLLQFGNGLPELTITVWPNPVSNYINLKISGTIGENGQLIITDAKGRIVKHLEVPGAVFRVDISDLPGGIYFVKYADSKDHREFKILRQ